MDDLFLSDFEWVLPLAGVIGMLVFASLDSLPSLLRLEISRRVEASIVMEHDTRPGDR